MKESVWMKLSRVSTFLQTMAAGLNQRILTRAEILHIFLVTPLGLTSAKWQILGAIALAHERV
jgi:hypothetical protein